MTTPGRLALASVLALALAGPASAADPAKLPLLLRASNVSKAAIEQLAPRCAAAAAVAVDAVYANNPAVAKDVMDGAPFDVVIVETKMLHDLAGKGFVAPASIRALASLRMAIATREPGPDPRIIAVADFRRALLGARSIGYAGDGHSGEVFLGIVDRRKLRSQLAGRLVPFTGAYAGAAEASGRLQYVVAPFFTPLPTPLRLVGYLPRSLGADVDVSAGSSPSAKPAATAFIACLKTPAAQAVFRASGYRLDR